jgi:ribosomal protein S18 acetylase RimI-like enzyme
VVAEILGDAFRDDPVMSWLIPNDRRRHAGMPVYFRAVAKHVYLPHHLVYLTTDASGAALWLPAGVSADSAPMLPALGLAWRLFWATGVGGLRRANTLLTAFHANHPAEPHYYLHAVGVRHGQQGRGIGSALIRHVTELCDRERRLAYLENSNERNLPLYERHGFRVLREWRTPGGEPPIWFMAREFQPDA